MDERMRHRVIERRRTATLWAAFGLLIVLALASCGAPGTVGPVAPTIRPLTSLTCAAALAVAPPAPTPMAHKHLTYTLTLIGPLPLQQVWRPGSVMRFHWCPTPDLLSANARPTPETLSVQLVGPFASRAAALADQSAHDVPQDNPQSVWAPTQAAVTLKQPLRTDTWANTQLAATLTLPTTLPSGYYIFVALNIATITFPSDVAQGDSSVSRIISIT